MTATHRIKAKWRERLYVTRVGPEVTRLETAESPRVTCAVATADYRQFAGDGRRPGYGLYLSGDGSAVLVLAGSEVIGRLPLV